MSVSTSADSSDSYSATLPSAYRQKSTGIHQSTGSSIPAKTTGHHFPSESTFYTLRNNRRSINTSHIDTKPISTAAVAAPRPKLSSAGISKTSFYKEMVPLSRRTLNNSDNVWTKIQQFEGIKPQKEKDDSHSKSYGLPGIASELRELDSSPQQHSGSHSKVRRSGTWSFHSPAPMQTQPPLQAGGGGGGTRKFNAHTHYTFQCPKVKSEVMHR